MAQKNAIGARLDGDLVQYPVGWASWMWVDRVEVYKNDTITKWRINDLPGHEKRSGSASIRQAISEFSSRSRARLAFCASNAEVSFRSMITLTYPESFATDGEVVKRHLNAFLVALRRRFGKVGYLWFLEFQKRGAPHFHVLTDIALNVDGTLSRRRGKAASINVESQRWASVAWARIVNSGDGRHVRAGVCFEALKSEDGGARYATKYAYKMDQKRVPLEYQNVGRFWAMARHIRPQIRATIPAIEAELTSVLGEKYQCPSGLPFRVFFGGSKLVMQSFLRYRVPDENGFILMSESVGDSFGRSRRNLPRSGVDESPGNRNARRRRELELFGVPIRQGLNS